jgi:hypothetical protein
MGKVGFPKSSPPPSVRTPERTEAPKALNAPKVETPVNKPAAHTPHFEKSLFEEAKKKPRYDILGGGTPVSVRKELSGPGGGGPPVPLPPPPYADTRTLDEIRAARDGSPQTTIDWARYQWNSGGQNYDDQCLDFCLNATGVGQHSERCLELYNPGRFGFGPNADGEYTAHHAFQALQSTGKILPADGNADPTQELPQGALVFFEATDKNKGAGHVCIATGRMAADGTPEVITSGFPPDHSGVHYSSVGQLEEQSGDYLGYTTPETAFAPGTYNAGTTTAPAGDGAAVGSGGSVGGTEAPGGVSGAGAAAANPAGDAQQAWMNTCGANALMTMEAAVSSERASLFQGMTPEQRAAYEGAVMRSDARNPEFPLHPREPGASTRGWGTTMMEWQVSERFGGEAISVTPTDRNHAVDELSRLLESERPVAIGLGQEHWMSATDIRGTAPDRELLVHDSWTGTSAWVSEAVMRDKPNQQWVREYFPGAPFTSAIASLVAPGEPVLEAGSTNRAAEQERLPGVVAELGD